MSWVNLVDMEQPRYRLQRILEMNMKKKVVMLGMAALLGAGTGAGLGYGPLLKYKTEGVLSMEMGTAEYKRFSELANDATTATP